MKIRDNQVCGFCPEVKHENVIGQSQALPDFGVVDHVVHTQKPCGNPNIGPLVTGLSYLEAVSTSRKYQPVDIARAAFEVFILSKITVKLEYS